MPKASWSAHGRVEIQRFSESRGARGVWRSDSNGCNRGGGWVPGVGLGCREFSGDLCFQEAPLWTACVREEGRDDDRLFSVEAARQA
eukprot:5119417-Pleurochrysis_carterae.AAC.2